MTLAIFDLDNTLLAGDSDHLWGEFLVERGIVDARAYREANDRFYRDYQAGNLNIHEYLDFALDLLRRHPPEQLEQWRREFLDTRIEPIILPAGRDLLDRHRRRGDHLMIITATNDFITAPIAERLEVGTLLATLVERRDGHYTGKATGVPCYREGKVRRLGQWLEETGESLSGGWFYSDSHNDIPLLERVDNPVAVDPDPLLEETARKRGWHIMSLREE